MAYDDEKLAMRIRKLMACTKRHGKMLGGVAIMLNGNMFCGVVKDDVMARVGPDSNEDSLAKPHARPMDFTGRPPKR